MDQRRDKIPTAAKIRYIEALQCIVQLYQAWDKPDETTEWKQRLAKFQIEEADVGESAGIEKELVQQPFAQEYDLEPRSHEKTINLRFTTRLRFLLG